MMVVLMFMKPGATTTQHKAVLREIALMGIENPILLKKKQSVFQRVLLWETTNFSREYFFAILHKMAGTDFVKVLDYPAP